MSIYTLYKKTHLKTGLQYLGYTGSKNPQKYKGSGRDWQTHIKLHGYDVVTEILIQTNNLSDIRKFGLYLSYIWDVVDSNAWANLKPESGEAGWPTGPEFNKKLLAQGNHPSQRYGFKDQQRNGALLRIENGSHNFLGSNLHKKRLAEGRHSSQIKASCLHCKSVYSSNGLKQHFAACKLK
jgi:hypothetical protein